MVSADLDHGKWSINIWGQKKERTMGRTQGGRCGREIKLQKDVRRKDPRLRRGKKTLPRVLSVKGWQLLWRLSGSVAAVYLWLTFYYLGNSTSLRGKTLACWKLMVLAHDNAKNCGFLREAIHFLLVRKTISSITSDSRIRYEHVVLLLTTLCQHW